MEKNKFQSLLNNFFGNIIVFIFISTLYLFLNIKWYTQIHLNGNIDNHTLSSEYFRAPDFLKQKGYETFYKDKKVVGWDGQFYFMVANDLLDQKKSAVHMDAPAYRYQRIGLGIWATVLAGLSGQDWVSPKLMLASYIFLYILALFGIYYLFKKFSTSSAFYLYLWPFAIMTQITIMNSLPDAAADAFFILSLVFLFRNQFFIYSLFITLSMLSREAYIVFPAFIFLTYFIKMVSEKKIKSFKSILSLFYFALPGLAFIFWQIWIRLHFQISPSKQAPGMIGTPLIEWFEALKSAANVRDQLLVVSCFVLLIYSIKLAINAAQSISFKKFSLTFEDALIFSLATLSLLYFCFGGIVMMHWSGFLKPMSLFLFLFPLFFSFKNIKVPRLVNLVFFIFFAGSMALMYSEKIGIEHLFHFD